MATRISTARWDELQWEGNRPDLKEIALVQNGKVVGYAVSPDGYGAYYFDTLEELRESFGELD